MTDDAVREALATISDPCSLAAGRPIDIVSMGLVTGINVLDDHVEITLRLTEPSCMYRAWFIRRIKQRLGEGTAVRFSTDLLWPTFEGDEVV